DEVVDRPLGDLPDEPDQQQQPQPPDDDEGRAAPALARDEPADEAGDDEPAEHLGDGTEQHGGVTPHHDDLLLVGEEVAVDRRRGGVPVGHKSQARLSTTWASEPAAVNMVSNAPRTASAASAGRANR